MEADRPATLPYSLIKTYKFKDFATALLFTNTVGMLAEEEGHHPRLVTEWGRTEVSWWTHAIRGVSDWQAQMNGMGQGGFDLTHLHTRTDA